MFDELTEENLLLYAAKNYYNPICVDAEEFIEDLNRFKYIKRLINKYIESGNLSDRLLLNHLIVVYNVFGIEAANRILELKLNDIHWTVIKPFLVFLRYITNDEYLETTMDPNTRRLVQLTIDDADKMMEIMDMLLAKKRASDRKNWLEASGDMVEID